MKKNKTGHGGARPGAGGGSCWKHGRTKLVRLPVALVDKILEVARYMDQNEGRLPLPDRRHVDRLNRKCLETSKRNSARKL
jgi:hypothetical protein